MFTPSSHLNFQDFCLLSNKILNPKRKTELYLEWKSSLGARPTLDFKKKTEICDSSLLRTPLSLISDRYCDTVEEMI